MTYRLPATILLVASLVGCDQIQEAMNGGSEGGSSSGSTSSGSGSSGSGGSSSGGSADVDDAPRGPIEIGVKTTPATKVLPGSSTALPPPPIALDATQCNDLTDGGETINDCITGVIKCGQTVTGHTRGGVNHFDTKFWEKHTCWPATVQHDGGDERIYKFTAEARGRVYFTLDTPCADLDLVAMHYSGSTCPTIDSRVADCEGKLKEGTKRESVNVPAEAGWEYLVVVEGRGDEEGPFALTAQCGPWR